MVAAGRHLQLSYFDHPPLAWWMARGASWLAGSEAGLVVRTPFILTFGLTTWLLYRLTSMLFSPRAGLFAAVALNLSPVFGITTGRWVLPDGPLVCALLAGALRFQHALRAERPNSLLYWVAAGVAAGLALLWKYSAVLILGGALLFLLTDPVQRRWLARPGPYVAAGVAWRSCSSRPWLGTPSTDGPRSRFRAVGQWAANCTCWRR